MTVWPEKDHRRCGRLLLLWYVRFSGREIWWKKVILLIGWCGISRIVRSTSKNFKHLPSSFSFKENKPVLVFSKVRHKLLLANQVCSFLIVETATDCNWGVLWLWSRRVVSSAYWTEVKSGNCDGSSFTYKMNKKGHSINPCGTPALTGRASDLTPSRSTSWKRPEKYDLIICSE